MKFCKDCRYGLNLTEIGWRIYCINKKSAGVTNLATGFAPTADVLRSDVAYNKDGKQVLTCGPSARWFEPREEK